MDVFPYFLPYTVSKKYQEHCISTVLSKPEQFCLERMCGMVQGTSIRNLLVNAATHLAAFDITDIEPTDGAVRWYDKPEFTAITQGFAFGLSSGGLLTPSYPMKAQTEMKTQTESYKCIANIFRNCSIDPYTPIVTASQDDITHFNQQSYERMQEMAELSCTYIDRVNGLEDVAERITDVLMSRDISNNLSFRTAYTIGVGAVAGASYMLEMSVFESQMNGGVDIDRLCDQLLRQGS